jgi:hypothetical protein
MYLSTWKGGGCPAAPFPCSLRRPAKRIICAGAAPARTAGSGSGVRTVLRRGCVTLSFAAQGTPCSGDEQSPGRGNRAFRSGSNRKSENWTVVRLGSRRSAPTLRSVRACAPGERTRGQQDQVTDGQRRRRDGGEHERPERSSAQKPAGAQHLHATAREHYTFGTRPIVAAVHRALPATYGTPGRTGSVSAECPSQGSGFPCAILAGRASRASGSPRAPLSRPPSHPP